MPELWRTVAECDRYEVSNLGRVRHKQRRQPLKPHMRCGYPYIQLGSRHQKRNIHQLVCAAWHGPRPEGMLACHRNDIKTDNRPENLYWGSRLDNAADAVLNDRQLCGEAVAISKLTAADVVEMRRLRAEGMVYQKLAERFSVTKRAAILVCKRQTWRHIT